MNITTPEEVGVSSTRLNRISSVMQGYVDQNIIAGFTTMLARHGKVFHFDCFGKMDMEANKPMKPDTIFRIYSMTKPIASVALMMLYEKGLFHLHDPVSTFIPEFKSLKVITDGSTQNNIRLTGMEREITFHDLLTHTSGLSYGNDEDSPVDDLYREAKLGDSLLRFRLPLKETVQKLSELPLAHQPGSQWRYSIATDVIGYLVGLISDMPFDTFVEEKILKPLGMDDTAFYVPPEKIDRLAAMYGRTEESHLGLIDAPDTSPYTNPKYYPSGGAGLVSTNADYMRFAQMLLNQGELDGTRLLSRKTIKLMTVNHLPSEIIPIQMGASTLHGYGFGLGFRVMTDVPQSAMLGSTGEYGWAGVANTYFWIDPKEKLIGLFMSQFFRYRDLPVPIRDTFRVLAYQALID